MREDALLGAQRARQRVVARSADGAEQDRVGAPRQLERRVGQRLSGRVVTGAADRRGFDRQVEAVGAQALEHAHGLGDDFDADAVAGENGDLHRDRPGGETAKSASEQILVVLLRLCRRSLHPIVSSEEPRLLDFSLGLERRDLVGVRQA